MAGKMWFVYHIKLRGMSLEEGYVGISVDPLRRWKEHTNPRYNYPLQRAIKKYGDSLLYEILGVFGSEEDARWQEYTLRPFPQIGWNILRGGMKCPSSNGHSQETRDKIALANSKRVITDATKKKQSDSAKSRLKPNRARPVNIFCYKTHEIVFQNVLLGVWSKTNKISLHLIYSTLKADLSEKSSRKNVHQTKGFYARYIL